MATVKMIRTVSGYVWGGIRLPAVGGETDVPEGCAEMLVEAGHAERVGKASAPVETAAQPVSDDVETADAPKPASKRRKAAQSS